jgi:hypothetical protein
MEGRGVHIRAFVPLEMDKLLSHLAIDLRMSKQDLVKEAILTLLWENGRGGNFPDPRRPREP